MAERKPWLRQAGETAKAYAAFTAYYQLSPRGRSVEAAWQVLAGDDQQMRGRKAPRRWWDWSSDNRWVARALAHDEHIAEQDRLLWEERRRELQRRDWEQADRMRRIVDEAQVMADQFLRAKTTTIIGVPSVVDGAGNIISHGTPTRQIITTALDIVAVSKVMIDASKLQRLATDEPTENINLTGAALDAYIAAQLGRLAHGGEASPGAPVEPDDAQADGGTEPDAGALPG